MSAVEPVFSPFSQNNLKINSSVLGGSEDVVVRILGTDIERILKGDVNGS